MFANCTIEIRCGNVMPWQFIGECNTVLGDRMRDSFYEPFEELGMECNPGEDPMDGNQRGRCTDRWKNFGATVDGSTYCRPENKSENDVKGSVLPHEALVADAHDDDRT